MISHDSRSALRLIAAICCSIAVAIAPLIATRVAWAGPADAGANCDKSHPVSTGKLCGTATACSPGSPDANTPCGGTTTVQETITDCRYGSSPSQLCEYRAGLACTVTYYCVPNGNPATACVAGDPVIDPDTGQPVTSTNPNNVGVAVTCVDCTPPPAASAGASFGTVPVQPDCVSPINPD